MVISAMYFEDSMDILSRSSAFAKEGEASTYGT